ncbi:MAG: hypothetical protein RIT45_4393 [Pseudomonadota bacterium]
MIEPFDLRDARLHDARLTGADLQDADLRHVDLTLADLRGARLRGARLAGADLSLADLSGADLRGADLGGALLEGADLREADLEGADLDQASLGGARVAGARGLAPERLAETTAPELAERRGTEAFAAARKAHGEGRLGLAELRYRRAAAWLPSLGAPQWGVAAVRLERADAAGARDALDAAVVAEPDADRARLAGLALTVLARAHGAPGADADLWARVEAARRRGGRVAELAEAVESAPDDATALARLRDALPDEPAVRFAAERLDRAPRAPRRGEDAAAQLADPAFRESEREALLALLADRRADAASLQAALVRALGIGAMDLAARAEQRLVQRLPEARLWAVALRELDVTAEAFETLVRTRRGRLGTIRAMGWLALGAHGPTARLETESGVYFAKRYQGATRSAAAVAFTHRIQRAAREAGLGAPRPIGDRRGDDLLVFGGDVLALYDARPGVTVGDDDLTPAEARLLGRTLATLHEALAPLAHGAGRPHGGLRVGTRLLRSGAPGAAFEAAVAAGAGAALWYERSGLRFAIEGRLAAIGERIRPWLADVRPAVVHGDFGAGNVLVDDDGGVSVLDWDLCDVDLGVWDLARAIDRAALHWPSDEPDPVEIRRAVAAALLHGYTEVRPLHAGERAVLPTLVAASRVDLDAGVLALLAGHDGDAATLVAERLRKRLDRAVAGAPEIDAALTPG